MYASWINQSGFIDLFWPGVLIVEQKSAGRDLARAYGQAGEYFDSLSERVRPRYILVSDFQTFELHDLDEGEHITFPLADLHDHVEEFRLHPRRATPNLPRSGSGQRRSLGIDGTAA